MKTLKNANIILKESDKSKIKELKAKGFVEIDEKGNVVGGKEEKTVSLDEHNALKDENEALKKENATLKGQITKLENTAKEKDKK